MGMVLGETSGDRDAESARGEPVAAVTMAVSAAYDAHGEALRRYLARFTRDSANAEDLVHETFIRLLVESTAGRQPANVRAWLFRVGVNLATSRARRQGVAARRAAELIRRDVWPSPEEELMDREAARALDYRLAALPSDVRAALLLSADGYSSAEIGRCIGRSELATRSLLSRQRSRLRNTVAA